MRDINVVCLIGNVSRDAQLKYMEGGQQMVKFGLCVHTTKKTEDGFQDVPNFVDITLFGKNYENLSSLITKGKRVAIDGEFRMESWERDGKTQYKASVVARHVQLC